MISVEKELVQWEKHKEVEVTSDYEFNEVHFGNRHYKEALVTKPKNGKAPIPNILLTTADDISVWLVYSDGEVETVFEKARFEVASKPKPPGYVYEETEVITFKKLVEEVDKAVDNANAISKDLEEKRDSGYFNGKDGKDAYGFDYAKVDEDGDLIIHYVDGTTKDAGHVKGENGKDGTNGVDGKDGKDGAPGPQGPQGIPGKDGAQGPKGDKGDKGDRGEPGVNGTNGTNGTNGKDGKTPVKGVDYYTDAEKQDLIAEITESVTGDIDVALDNIIAIQNELIGGGSV